MMMLIEIDDSDDDDDGTWQNGNNVESPPSRSIARRCKRFSIGDVTRGRGDKEEGKHGSLKRPGAVKTTLGTETLHRVL